MKNELKCKVRTVISVNYNDLERFIKAETGREYEIACQEEVGNDTEHTYNVEAKLDLYNAKEWVDFKAGSKTQYILRTILCGLCLEGKLQAGEYLVRVSW